MTLRLNRLFDLQCGVQDYFWGGRKHGDKLPYIAEVLGITDCADEPYAELWIGTHPRNPSLVRLPHGPKDLGQFIAEHPREILGTALVKQGIVALPFLLKVLDCEIPLSIQAHPDRPLAAKLHARDPAHYPDNNHKPEIAIALTPFAGLCQFRERTQIQNDFTRIAALGDAFADCGLGSDHPDWLRHIYRHLFMASEDDIVARIADIVEELGRLSCRTAEDECFLQLQEHFPGDRGTLCAYFMNLVRLEPGQAVFLAACEPHAYLRGTIVECMANSDNVVRAGLTPKFIDGDVLLDMLTYREGKPRVWAGDRTDAGTQVYCVPVPEFQIAVLHGDRNEQRVEHSHDAVSLLLVLEGEVRFEPPEGPAVRASRGSVWLWPAAAKHMGMTFLAPETCIVRASPGR